MIFFAGSLSASVLGEERAPTMIANARSRCPASSLTSGRSANKGQAKTGPQNADQRESPSIEIDNRIFAQRLATETDLDGDPGSGDSTEN